MRFGVVARGKLLLYRIASMNEGKLGSRRSFCNSKPAAINNSSSNDDCSSSLITYEEQYKALDKLDFMTSSKILFTEPPKKKFGLDFHLVQLFFACLPSLAVYLLALYAHSEMDKMDAYDQVLDTRRDLSLEEEDDDEIQPIHYLLADSIFDAFQELRSLYSCLGFISMA